MTLKKQPLPAAQENYLRANYGLVTDGVIATHMQIPRAAVARHAHRLGLDRTAHHVKVAGLQDITATAHTYGHKLPAAQPAHGPAEFRSFHNSVYTCPELRTGPSIPPARLAAFALPSRVGHRLHYPDGRVEVIAA